MKNTEQMKRIMTYFNMMRMLADGAAVEGLAVAKAVKDKVGNNFSEDILFREVDEASCEYGIRNPFKNRRDMMEAYHMALQMDLDWEMILAGGDPRETGSCHIPAVLIELLETSITNETKSVLIPEADKFAPYLGELIDRHPECEFTLTAMNELHVTILKKAFAEKYNVEVLHTSIYEYEFVNRKFDAIMSVPVFGARDRMEDGRFICREYEMIAVENLLLHLNGGGKLTIVLPGKITFAAGRVKELRDFVQSMYKLEEIAELPVGVFQNTGIKTYFLSITTGSTDDVMVKRYLADNDNPRKNGIEKFVTDIDTFVMQEELEEIGDWNLNRIFASQDDDWKQYQESSSPKVMLGTVAQIFRGKSVNRKDENGEIGVINISNIREFDIDYDGLDHLDEEERKIVNFRLMEGDLVLPARGTAIRVGVFKEQAYPCIASSNVVVIRPDQKMISSVYLKMFLDSPVGNRLIAALQQGSSVINLSYKDLVSLEIPFPTMSEQQEIADTYQKELDLYRETISQAEKRWSDVLVELQNRL